MQYISPRMRVLWKLLLLGNRGNITYEGSDYPARIAEIYIWMMKALHDGGAKIILGMDTEVNIVLLMQKVEMKKHGRKQCS